MEFINQSHNQLREGAFKFTFRDYNFYLRNLSKREIIGILLNSLGLAYDRKRMHDEAIIEYKKAIEINPNFAEAHINLTEFYYYKEKYSLAIEHCDRAIELGYKGSFELLKALNSYR